MATLNILESTRQGRGAGRGDIDAPELPALVEQAVTLTATSAQSAAFADATRIVTVTSDVAARIAVGADPTAAADGFYLAAGVPFTFGLDEAAAKAGVKIAARTA